MFVAISPIFRTSDLVTNCALTVWPCILMAQTAEPNPPLCSAPDQISMAMTRKQLNKPAPLSISWNKANTADNGVNIHLLTEVWIVIPSVMCPKAKTKKKMFDFTQTFHSSALCGSHPSLSSSLFTSDHAAALTATPRTERLINQRRLFLTQVASLN